MARGSSAIYYDTYDFEIDDDPYPIWKRMRDEMPLYRNERFEFLAVSRFADVEACSRDWQTFVSSKGTVLEMICARVLAPRPRPVQKRRWVRLCARSRRRHADAGHQRDARHSRSRAGSRARSDRSEPAHRCTEPHGR